MYRQAFQEEAERQKLLEIDETDVIPGPYDDDIVNIEKVYQSTKGRLLLEEQITDYIWWEKAACKGLVDATELYYALESTRDEEIKQSAEAIKIACGFCAVRTECLNFALENQEHGIWGGTTEDERYEMFGVKPHLTARKF
jgi:hypothetical protein